jgi:hypothetical protein
VIATKVHGRMRPGPNGAGLSRRAIMAEIDNSLRRLGTDYVDLYQIHRWDPETPIEETLEALHDVVKAGKARYIGASSMHAWQFAQACWKTGWTSGQRWAERIFIRFSSPRTVKWRLVFTSATSFSWQAAQTVSGCRDGRATRPLWAAGSSEAFGSPWWQVSQPSIAWVLVRNPCFTR